MSLVSWALKLGTEDQTCSEDYVESLFVEILSHKARDIIAGVMYKPAGASHNDEFMPTFQNLFCSYIWPVSQACFISGDFNINLLIM